MNLLKSSRTKCGCSRCSGKIIHVFGKKCKSKIGYSINRYRCHGRSLYFQTTFGSFSWNASKRTFNDAHGRSIWDQCCSIITHSIASGELSYITKRIDRTEAGEKIHMIDMFQITEAFDKYKSSMEKIGAALNDYSTNTLLDKVFYFELTLFSFLTGNNDMHLKNFSMIEKPSGWVLAPAYDLLNASILNPSGWGRTCLNLIR